MKKSVLRILCASLLMGIALAVTAAIFASSREEVYVWQSVRFASEDEVRLYDQNGECDPRQLLPTGEYYAISGDVRTEFTITNDGIEVHSGGWTDGQTVHMTNHLIGSVAVEFVAEERFYEFELKNGEDTRLQIVRGYAGQMAKCDFFGLPFGDYELFLDDRRVAVIHIDEKIPMVIVTIP